VEIRLELAESRSLPRSSSISPQKKKKKKEKGERKRGKKEKRGEGREQMSAAWGVGARKTGASGMGERSFAPFCVFRPLPKGGERGGAGRKKRSVPAPLPSPPFPPPYRRRGITSEERKKKKWKRTYEKKKKQDRIFSIWTPLTIPFFFPFLQRK